MMEEVGEAIREIGTTEVLSRFRSLEDGDIVEKGPGDLVTIADRECERLLSERLRAIRDIPVVGEEATAADGSLLDLVATAEAVWTLDPVDGTSNFVAGDPRFAVMVALVEHGAATAAWVWSPVTGAMLSAERGRGSQLDGAPIIASARSGQPRGIIKRKYMPEPTRSRLADFPESIGTLVPGRKCAAVEYAALIGGEIDFLGYWRTLPWDHAPGGLLAEESGLRVARPDGSPYRPGDGRVGLIAAAHDRWDLVAAEIRSAIDE